ncbi:hypothetical protein NG800_012525 [Epilithonimonas ginsengisoli]|uniref:Uncharacterized protein n=1 Tax=Epilithonimonas ginsengisoli TaxID=1245592 RepID=A0ABU4JJ90_9FLAO|nr:MULTISPECIES: hypothetical protein [Chryseobacterium group]MBV6880289.1 hypothetical protein [Epilithonimonas sp. FP105]MDW8549741.1 hypothetical protein [Epilithonimonas ginsengisoli]OAH72178.1 hypothetical protein AXA65_10530 [Chryseobacterium sp. FP211-J200]
MDFLIDRDKLIKKLEILIRENPNVPLFRTLKYHLQLQDSSLKINGVLSKIIIDNQEINSSIGKEITEFENHYKNIANLIESKELKNLIEYLVKKKISINFVGKAWSENVSTWVYFNTILNLSKIRKKLSLSENIIEHKNTDPRSGLEAGFIDKITNEGVMGNLKII